MRNARVLIFAGTTLLALAFFLHAQTTAHRESSDMCTARMSNGRAWIIMPLPMKTAYIRGALDSFLLCLPQLDWSKPTVPGVIALWQAEISTDEYRESLDGFYSLPSNRPVPIVHAMTWTRMIQWRVRNKTQRVQRYLARSRGGAEVSVHRVTRKAGCFIQAHLRAAKPIVIPKGNNPMVFGRLLVDARLGQTSLH